MKNFIKFFGIIAIIAIIGFSMIACKNSDDDDKDTDSIIGSGQFAGKDVLGNSYSLSVGSDASRSAVKGDNFKMNLSTRDGKTRNVTGTVTAISDDGTLTLKENSSNIEFTAKTDGTVLETVIGNNNGASLSLNDGTKFIPRTFDSIFLRAVRWGSTADEYSGENWGSGVSVLVKDFPANVSMLQSGDNDRYTITISGTSDVNITNLRLEIQGLTENDEWVYLGGSSKDQNKTITAGTPFNHTIKIDNLADISSVKGKGNFMEYKEVILQVTNLINIFNYTTNLENNGTIADADLGSIMATISDFKIKLVDTQRTPITGNLGDYTYCIQEDGLSVDYRMARWELDSATITKAKQAGAKLEITVAADIGEPTLNFVWQDPVRELWWQDQSWICGGVEANAWAFGLADGVTWDADAKKMTINIDEFINDNRFASATAVNFIIACWWGSNDDKTNIDTFKITKAEIITE